MSQSRSVADHPLRSAMHHGLGEPLPHQLANAARAHPSATPESVFYLFIGRQKNYAVLAPVSKCYPL